MIERISAARRRALQERGFTLIELLVVIIILGIITAVVVFAVRGVGDRGASAAYANDAKTLRTAEEAFCGRFGQYGTERQLAGLDPAPDGKKYKFISEPSEYHEVEFVAGGPCTGAGDNNRSGYFVSCDAGKAGCSANSTIARGGTLVVGGTFDMTPTNVSNNTNGSNHAYWEIMYNGLISMDEKGNPSPELATEVPTVGNGGILDGGKTYVLHLRNDVFWHDSGVATTASAPSGNTNPTGAVQQFTATDVKFTFEKSLLRFHSRTRNMVPALASWDATNFVASIDVVDPFTVRFRFNSPYAPFLKQLNVTEAPMNPAHAYTGSPTSTTLDGNKVGTGPFKYAGLNDPQAGDAKVVRNDKYWRPGLPYLDAIVIRPMTVDSTRYNALLNGEVDWLWDVPNPSVADLQTKPNFKTAPTQSLGGGPNSIDQLIFNLTVSGTGTTTTAQPNEPARYGQIGGPNPTSVAPPHPILGDVNVRKAIFQAIDRAKFLNPGRNNIGTIATAPISSELPQHATDITLPSFNPGAGPSYPAGSANALLDAAGWGGPRTSGVSGIPDGTRTALNHPTLADNTPLKIRFLYGNAVYDSRVLLMKQDLKDVGIFLEEEKDTANANARVFTHRNFDMYVLNYAQGYDPHVGVRRQYHSDQVSTTNVTNAAGYKNASVDTWFDQAAQTIDPAARFNLYHNIQVQVAQDLPYMWMIETPNVRGYTSKCANLRAWTGLFAESGWCSKLR